MAYPIEPGHEKAIKNIYDAPPANPENYAYEQKLKKLRKLFYVDLPEQTGDTPPTLGQWLDERRARSAASARPACRSGATSADFHPLQVSARGDEGDRADNGRRPQCRHHAPQPGPGRSRAAGIGGSRPHRTDPRRDVSRGMENEYRRPQDHGGLDREVPHWRAVMRKLDDVKKAVDQMAQLAGARHTGGVDESQPPDRLHERSEVHPTQEACFEAIDRIARTPDGAMLYVFLQRRLMSTSVEDFRTVRCAKIRVNAPSRRN
jgi:hypothetical protein